jgi:arylsulfatase
MDVVPTFLDLARVSRPAGHFGDHAIKPIRGLSWADWLRDRRTGVYLADKPVGEELFGSRSLRQGDWKVTDIGDGSWRLFNVASDPGETRDLSSIEPARKVALVKAWENYAKQVGVVMPKPRATIIDRPIKR